MNGININAHINPGNILEKYTGKNIKIAVIDFGLDVTHEDLQNNTVIKTYSLHNGTDVSDVTMDGIHGTPVTGIIAANKNKLGIRGIAHESKIIFLKIERNSTDSDVIELFNKAEEFGADVINCSWGTVGDTSESVINHIKDLAQNGRNGKGLSIVFASGNEEEIIGDNEANISEVITVGATDKFNTKTYYSNFGENLDVLAPGGKYKGIVTTDVMGNLGYSTSNYTETFTGTSAATPVVTGVIALMLEKDYNLTRVQIEDILKNTADKIGASPYTNGRNDIYGHGKINLKAIMEAI